MLFDGVWRTTLYFCVLQNKDGSSKVLRYALKHNRVEFIKYILECVDISKYLNDEELLELYNSQVLNMDHVKCNWKSF